MRLVYFTFCLSFFFSAIRGEIPSPEEFLISSKKPIDANLIAHFGGKYFYTSNNTKLESNDEIIVENNHPVNLTQFTNQSVGLNLWNLDILDGVMNNEYTYLYTGQNVTVYVIDSGISPDPEFENRILPGISISPYNNDTSDCNGHGTFVSGCVAAKTYGVAKKAYIVPVKVFGCGDSTTTSVIIQAISWVSQKPKGIVNLSLLGSYSSILNDAIADLVEAGFIVVVAAGNYAQNACNFSPSSSQYAITVGCTTIYNSVCSYSNQGSCTTLYAPGDDILGVNAFVSGGTTYMSGTSMSSPVVTGIAAMILEAVPYATPAEIKQILINISANNTLSGFNIPGSTNLAARVYKNIIKFKCAGLKKAKCENSALCKFISDYGCKPFNFCGFKNKKQCLQRKYCKYTDKKCN